MTSNSTKNFIWVVRSFDFIKCKEEMRFFTHPQFAYNYCREYLKKYDKEDFYSDYCSMLCHSYSDSRADFGIENVISAKRYEIEQ